MQIPKSLFEILLSFHGILTATRNQHSFFLFIFSGYPQMPFPWYPQAGNVPAPQVPFTTPPQTPAPPPPQAAQPAPAPAPAQAPQPQANENVQANANAGPLFDDEDDEDNANRDWLDKIYTLCRIGILLSIFWFYSSTTRFLLLVLTFVLIYLYQYGFFQIFLRNRGRYFHPFLFFFLFIQFCLSLYFYTWNGPIDHLKCENFSYGILHLWHLIFRQQSSGNPIPRTRTTARWWAKTSCQCECYWLFWMSYFSEAMAAQWHLILLWLLKLAFLAKITVLNFC